MPVAPRKLETGLRVVDGDHDGLNGDWRFWFALLEPGRITASWRTPLLQRRLLLVEVLSVYTSPVREMGWAWQMSVNPGAPVLQLRTERALLDWVIVHPSDREWAVERLRPGSQDL